MTTTRRILRAENDYDDNTDNGAAKKLDDDADNGVMTSLLRKRC